SSRVSISVSPLKPEITVDTEIDTLEDCVAQILSVLEERGVIPNYVVGD
ncbi:hypothetical protein Ga0076813_14393, partial [endosymbiont of Ridgeia piscesae]